MGSTESGFEWGWLIIILLFFMIFGGNGGGFFGGASSGASYVERDVLQNRYDNAIQLSNLASQSALESCGINRNIDQLRYESAQQTCEIITNANSNTQAILNYLQGQEIQTLRDSLQSANLTLAQANQTAVLEAYIKNLICCGCCGTGTTTV